MYALLKIVNTFFTVFMVMLFVRILSSWIPELRETRFIQFISFYTDPYLNFFKRIIPPIGMFDLSPIVAFLCLSFIEWIIKNFIVFLFS